MLMLTREQADATLGHSIYARDGRRVGTIASIYHDPAAPRHPGWVAVAGGLLGLRNRLIPLDGAEVEDDGVHVPLDGITILTSPQFERTRAVIEEDEVRRVWTHFGRAWEDYARTPGWHARLRRREVEWPREPSRRLLYERADSEHAPDDPFTGSRALGLPGDEEPGVR